jgi:ribonuclease HI
MSSYTIIKGSPTTPESACYLLQFDGLCVPNPGTATAGAILYTPWADETRSILVERGEFIGPGTNNIAEYTGLLIGVKSAADFGVKLLLIEGDSNLVVQQVSGNWKVNNEALKGLHKEIRVLLLTRFDFVAIRHVYRDKNVRADAITNAVFKTRQSFYRTV